MSILEKEDTPLMRNIFASLNVKNTYLQGSKLTNTLLTEKRGHFSKDTSTSLNIAFSLAVTQIQRNYEHHTTNVGKGRAINLLFV